MQPDQLKVAIVFRTFFNLPVWAAVADRVNGKGVITFNLVKEERMGRLQ